MLPSSHPKIPHPQVISRVTPTIDPPPKVRKSSYQYDFGDNWWHTVTLEEAREAGPENTFQILDGAGACPPEDCGGPAGYRHLVQALTDPADPDHDDAVEWLGEDYDPARYQPR